MSPLPPPPSIPFLASTRTLFPIPLVSTGQENQKALRPINLAQKPFGNRAGSVKTTLWVNRPRKGTIPLFRLDQSFLG
jgi:hypothetical protein